MPKQETSTAEKHVLPLVVQKRILKFCLKSPIPLILSRDASTPAEYRSGISPQILQVCQRCYQMGKPILYSKNTFTTSSATTSYDFDQHLTKLSGKDRKLITRVTLNIDWGDQLWAKFPLLARCLMELPLQHLVIAIVEKQDMEPGEERSVLKEVDTNQATSVGKVTDDGSSKGETTAGKVAASSGFKREGAMGDMMLNVEKKIIKDLLNGLPALQVFRLKGHRDEKFAKGLEMKAPARGGTVG